MAIIRAGIYTINVRGDGIEPGEIAIDSIAIDESVDPESHSIFNRYLHRDFIALTGRTISQKYEKNYCFPPPRGTGCGAVSLIFNTRTIK